MFSHLQADVFFGGYAAFFEDFKEIFNQFDRIILSVEHTDFEPELALRYARHIEVVHASRLKELKFLPQLIVCFNHYLFHKATQLFVDVNRILYYCQEFEACDFGLNEKFIEVEKSIVHSKNLIISTEILKKFLISRKLLSDNNIYITSPKIKPITPFLEKTKKIFFYFRPEANNQRNLSALIAKTVEQFCLKHTGYTIYMVGTVNTRYSYEINGTPIYVLSKLSKEMYLNLLVSCDVVISMIYAPHPGIIAFQAAASGIPAVTNIFENRDAVLLKSISENILPYDPLRDNLITLIEKALEMPKGLNSFNEKLYSGHQEGTLWDFIKSILTENNDLYFELK